MRVHRFRGNFIVYICFMVSAIIVAAGLNVISEYGVSVWEKFVDYVDQSNPVEDGEVGGIPTENTFVVSTYEDLQIAIENDYLFTIDLSGLPHSLGETWHYSWRTIRLDGYCFASLVNWDNIVDVGTEHGKLRMHFADYRSPVCRVVKGDFEAKNKLVEKWGDKAVVDYYLDMDGEAKSTYRSFKDIVLVVLTCIVGAVIFLLILPCMLGLTFFFLKILDKLMNKRK